MKHGLCGGERCHAPTTSHHKKYDDDQVDDGSGAGRRPSGRRANRRPGECGVEAGKEGAGVLHVYGNAETKLFTRTGSSRPRAVMHGTSSTTD